MRYRCIHRRRHHYPIRMMCRLLQVSRSGYYLWRERAESARRQRDRTLLQRIHQVHLGSRRVYGARKVHREVVALTCRLSSGQELLGNGPRRWCG